MIHIKAQAPHFQLPEYNWTIIQPDKRVSKYTHGYQWRSAVFEMLEFNPRLKQAILENKSAQEIEVLAIQQWFLTLKDNARLKMLREETSLEEIQRVL
jgi:type II secretory ATPase GspE/PulE/Tfp pilus assembly ATPase PilB-like protein